jgi:hypothetical protein
MYIPARLFLGLISGVVILLGPLGAKGQAQHPPMSLGTVKSLGS